MSDDNDLVIFEDKEDIPIGYMEDILDDVPKRNIKDDMARVASYCIQDSELLIDLFYKLNIWIALIETSNVVNVTPFDTYTRGQQLRVYGMIYQETRGTFIIDDRENPVNLPYEGGYVGDPIVGLHDNVICADFTSLYPSILLAYNICYTTYVPEEEWDKYKEEELHTIEVNVDKEEDEDSDNEDVSSVKMVQVYTFKFRKDGESVKSVLPKMTKRLLSSRRATKKLMNQAYENGDKSLGDILNQRQLAMKVSCNSVYGFLGAKDKGRLPFLEGALSITTKGRQLIKGVNKKVLDMFPERNIVIIYNDTDSSMFKVDVKDGENIQDIGEEIINKLNSTFDSDYLRLEFEKSMRILCIKKKKYAAFLHDPKGELNMSKDSMYIRGILTARRDNCALQRRLFNEVLHLIMCRGSKKDVDNVVIDILREFYQNQLPLSDLTIIKSMGSAYKSKTYMMRLFGEHLTEIGKPVRPSERVEYVIVRNKEQMIAEVAARITQSQKKTIAARLQYSKPWDYAIKVPKNALNTIKLGRKMRLVETYRERLMSNIPERIDKNYYTEKLIINCIGQLYDIAFGKGTSPIPGFLKSVQCKKDMETQLKSCKICCGNVENWYLKMFNEQ